MNTTNGFLLILIAEGGLIFGILVHIAGLLSGATP